MKSDIFYWVLNLSLHGSLVCLLLWLLRRIRPIPRRAIYPLWLGASLRLTMPWSFMALLKRLGAREVAPPTSVPVYVTTANSIQAAQSYFPITYQTDALRRLFETCALIWVIGALACLLTVTALYVMTRLELRGAKPLQKGVWESDRIVSPGLVGVLRPRIMVPPGTDGKLLDYIVRHESVHKRRLDNLWRMLALAICCLHWFNPAVWISLKLFFADMELSCDEAVLRKLPDDARKEYALALLSAAKGTDLFVSAFGGAKLRLRLQRVLSYRRLTAGAAIVFALLAGAVLSLLAFG